MRSRIDSYLGFAAKSRNLVSGYHACLHGIRQNRLKLLILSEDLSENTVKKLSGAAKENNVPFRIYGKSDDLSSVTGTQERGVFGITDENFANAVMREIDA